MKRALCLLLLSASAFAAETFHVSGIRSLQPNDPEPVSRAFRVQVVTGTAGGVRYVLQHSLCWGCQRLELGKDYEIKKRDSKRINLLVPDKKGRRSDELLWIVDAVEESVSGHNP